MKIGYICVVSALAFLPVGVEAAGIEFRLKVSQTCVAKSKPASGDRLAVDAFCNAPRGGTVYVVGSLSGPGRVLTVDGTRFTLASGGRHPIFASEGPFRNTIGVRMEGSDAASLFFHVVPNS